MTGNKAPTDPPPDYRRTMVLIVAALLLAGGIVSWWYGQGAQAKLVTAAMGRVGLVMGALWLAWPSLRRPARWLPPGMAVAGVLTLAILAAQPRLVLVAIPALMGLLTLAAVIRTLKR
ncbi:MAG: hypothetical protein MI861_00515 [Pirellulales bacterium]|nr:hypothetical protein [Pirellulales bacterium]